MPWPVARAIVITASISRGGLGFCPAESGEQHGRDRGEAGPGRRRDGLPLRDQRSSLGEIAAPDRKDGYRVHRDHLLGEQARLAAGLELAGPYRVPALLVPYHVRGGRGECGPSPRHRSPPTRSPGTRLHAVSEPPQPLTLSAH